MSARPRPAGAASTLERRYRLLLRCYPARYRLDRGSELIGTLLDMAAPGQRWPAPTDAADLVVNGLRRRAREDATPGLAGGLRIAGPVALLLAGALAGFLWLGGEWLAGAAATGPRAHVGPFRTLAPVAYAVWLVAVLGNATLPWAVARHDLLTAAVAATVLLPPAAVLTGAPRPPVWVVASLTLCGLAALAGSAAYAPPRIRRGVAVGAATGAGAAATVLRLWVPGSTGYYGPVLRVAGLLAAAMIGAVAVVGAVAGRRRMPWPRWCWSVLPLALPAAWLISVDRAPFALGRLGQFLLAASSIVAAMAFLAVRPRRASGGPRFVGPTAAACAAGLSGYFWLAAGMRPAYPAWLLAAAGWALLGTAWVRLLTALALGCTLVGGLPSYQVAALTAVGAVALCDSAQRSRRGIRFAVPVGGMVTLVAAVVVGAYAHNWRPAGWSDLLDAPALAALLALVPLILGSAWAVARLHSAQRRGTA
jgi:hypothetical protein